MKCKLCEVLLKSHRLIKPPALRVKRAGTQKICNKFKNEIQKMKPDRHKNKLYVLKRAKYINAEIQKQEQQQKTTHVNKTSRIQQSIGPEGV